MNWDDSIELTPRQFEQEIKAMLQGTSAQLTAFEVKHAEKLQGTEGVYEIDVTVRFQVIGAAFLILVECKQQKNPVGREIVQILNDRVHSTGAHKGMIFATTTFQRGAIEYARAHGIALVKIAEGESFYVTKGFDKPVEPPPWAEIPAYMGYFVSLTDSGNVQYRLISVRHPDALNEFLGFSTPSP
ncbi:MAG: restriction endonuclease [Dehalococcoidales bacterium]|nr:restriction endonuclease [Dehalococcoidales bacterium]